MLGADIGTGEGTTMDDKRTIAWFSAFVVVVLLAGVASGILARPIPPAAASGPRLRQGRRPGLPRRGPGGTGWGQGMGLWGGPG